MLESGSALLVRRQVGGRLCAGNRELVAANIAVNRELIFTQLKCEINYVVLVSNT